jgi:hypothetical protein
MTSLARGHPLWKWDDQQWSQHPETGDFEPVDFRGLGTPAPAYDPKDIAALIGARISLDPADRGSRAVALYPSTFDFSPVTGKALSPPIRPPEEVWLPPSGGDHGAPLGKPAGLRLTSVAISLPSTLTIESRPDAELPLPAAGHYHFIVGAFNTRAPSLLAVEPSKGLLFCWLPASQRWAELSPNASEVLPEASLSENAWGLASVDPTSSTQLFVPTDRGLGVLSLNLITLTYRVAVVGTRCMGAPAMWQGKTYVPMQGDDLQGGVCALAPGQLDAVRRLDGPVLNIGALEWTRPIIDRRQIIWMSSAGQLLAKQVGGTAPEVSFLPWGPGLTPRFDLGSPYLSSDGNLWQQCFREDASGAQFVFVQLARSEPTIHATGSPRLSTGSSSFKLETLLTVNPWVDPDEELDSQADEVIIPLLESVSRSTILCARVPSTSSIDSVFVSSEPYRATFELRGNRDVQFLVTRLTRPWATRSFAFAGYLYVYHPDLPRIQGWRMN